MCKGRIFFLSAFLLLIPISGSFAAEDQTPDAAKKLLRSYVRTSNIEKAKGYIKEAKDSGVDAEAITSAAKSRYKRHLADLKQSYEKLQAPVSPFLTMTEQSVFMKEFKEWHTSAKDTHKYIFDDASYAVPAKARTGWIPGVDIQPNQAIVEAKVEAVIEQWNSMITNFGRHARLRLKSQRDPGGGGYMRKLQSSRPEEMRMVQIPILQYKFADPASGLDSLTKKAENGYPEFKEAMARLQSEITLAKSAGYVPEKLKLKALPIAVGALFSGNTADAMTYKPAQGTDEGRIFAIYTALFLYLKSLDQPKFMSKAAHDALKTTNLYRLALGLFPMLPNEKLQLAADAHSVYQKKNGMGHTETHEETRTPKLRALKVGYKGGVTENCYSGSIENAVWTWRTDAGHHRNLLQSRAKVAGLSDKGLPTKNCGYICEDPKMAPLFKVAY